MHMHDVMLVDIQRLHGALDEKGCGLRVLACHRADADKPQVVASVVRRRVPSVAVQGDLVILGKALHEGLNDTLHATARWQTLGTDDGDPQGHFGSRPRAVSYTHLTLPTNR